ncbi:sensor histidine kinase [Microcella sp.]|uniref:sensor histidine kinase n=1 Tax=Microcella sp. TaxID=1913979 RepID=UPI003F6FBB8B
MFDRLITWFTPERRARILFPVEVALGAWLALAILLNQQWWGGVPLAVVNVGIALAMGVGTALHRVRADLAQYGLIAAGLGVIAGGIFGASSSPLILVGAVVIVFGGAAYGTALARSVALVVSVVVAAGITVAILFGGGTPVGLSLGSIILDTLTQMIWPVLALMPWVLGELVRSIRNRRQLSATVATVSTQRDAALTRADLEAERTRVARDVHDIVAHSLTVVIAQADGARYATAGDSPAAADAFETIAQTARDALADVRVLLTELRHTQEAGPQPGLGDLDALLAAMRDSGLALELREFGDRGRLTEARELALYRIVQESLTNALRHGDGAATLELEWGGQAVDLVVTNDAGGAAADGQRGHGIDGMRERASLAGGELSVHEGAVFRVRARLPLDERTAGPAEPADELVTTGAPE